MHYEHKLMVAACLVMMAASLLSVSREIHAQMSSTSVSAIVLPNEFNTQQPQKKNFFESLSTYQKIMVGSSATLALSAGVAFYLLSASKHKLQS